MTSKPVAPAAEGPGVEIRPMARERADLERFASCFARNGSPRSDTTLEWQYLRNPTRHLFVDFAVAGNASERLAAIHATMPMRMRIAGETVIGLQSVDTMTDADFRGRGLFLRLARLTYDRARTDGAKLVYGFPNGSSAHGFFQRLDWANLDPLPFLIRPLRTSFVIGRLRLDRYLPPLPDIRLVRRRAPDPRIAPLSTFDERATALWNDFATAVGVAVERDAAYLDWRLQKPGEAYRNHGIFERDRLSAFVSHVVKPKHGGRIGYVMESLRAAGCDAELRALLRHALSEMSTEGADVALAWCLPHSPTYRSYLRLGFVPFPKRLRPIELHFGAASFDPSYTSVVTNRNSWYLSYLDSDTV